MSDGFDLKICCMGAGYVGGPTMAVIAAKCPKVRSQFAIFPGSRRHGGRFDFLLASE